MSLNIGDNFKQRWLNTPLTIQKMYYEQLQHVSTLFNDNISIEQWQQQHTILEQRSHQIIAYAYQELLQKEILARQQQIRSDIAEKAHQNNSPTDQASDLKLMLELEAEHYIEQVLQQIKEKLKSAAAEEIQWLTNNNDTKKSDV